jgi:hypothetical protein
VVRRRNRNTKDAMELATGQEIKGFKGAVLAMSLVQDREGIHINYKTHSRNWDFRQLIETFAA